LWAREQLLRMLRTFLISPLLNRIIASAALGLRWRFSSSAISFNLLIILDESKGPNLNLVHLDYKAGIILET